MAEPSANHPLSPATLEMILRALQNRILPQVLEGGEELVDRSAVQSLEALDESTLLGEVRDHGIKCVRLTFSTRGLASTECTCAHQYWCKHAAAILLMLKAASSPTDKKRAALPTAAAAQVAPGSLADAVAKKLNLEMLPPTLVQVARAIEEWFKAGRQTITTGDLSSLAATGSRLNWMREEVLLYTTSWVPQTAMEMLYCVEAAMQKRRMKLPPPFPQAVDAAWVAQLNESLEREKVIHLWKQRLHLWVSDEQDAPIAPRFRLRMEAAGAIVEYLRPGGDAFTTAKASVLREWCSVLQYSETHSELDPGSRLVLSAAAVYGYGNSYSEKIAASNPQFIEAVSRILSLPDLAESLVGERGQPLAKEGETISWQLGLPKGTKANYALKPIDASGKTPEPPIVIVRARADLSYYVTATRVLEVSSWPFLSNASWPVQVPSEVMESPQGVALLQKLGIPLPETLGQRVVVVSPKILVRCRIHPSGKARTDYFQLQASVDFEGAAPNVEWAGVMWRKPLRPVTSPRSSKVPAEAILRPDRAALQNGSLWLQHWTLKRDETSQFSDDLPWWEQRILGREFPETFMTWLKDRPPGVTIELDPELKSLSEGSVTGSVRLHVEETSMDWFDLRVDLEISDLTLSKEEIDLLLKAQGKWVRLEGKGWRKLDIHLTPEQQADLAEAGIAIGEFGGTPQRLHALQLTGVGARSLLPAQQVTQIARRAQEIQTRVTPELPSAIQASLRPYQLEGFHFLAYLTTNRFGGILADDMGLGKTLQTLVWIAWLRETQEMTEPVLVVCPKSVQENWRGEAAKFFPGLRALTWNREAAGTSGLNGSCDLLIIHYQQLRQHEDLLVVKKWGAVILDEAQAIKNPSSQSQKAACRLQAGHRLALSGTPVENRLMDLWSIMAFAMPGALGGRASFAKHFDAKADPLARKRLSARTRPFLLRRTKKEVAADLPERIEEDLICELEGAQAKLYQAELKRARAQLLKLQTSRELDKARFNVLTSLLRLRQICCHPKLVGHEDASTESAKFEALMELLEPILEEGGKVLVFSQFVEMLLLIQKEIQKREWPHFLLTGQTEDRGDLVQKFQETEGASVFLISLKAGGMGLNLTAASYVVLCDPWWNPAVEAQAIDRAHRIGQTQTVIAYRLLVKDSIEEKIRQLQKHKGALAQDILGEENFASALSLDDFRFLLEGD